MKIFIDYAPVDNCQSKAETYGQICIQCNKCGRFDKDEVINDENNNQKNQ